jgi:hypothetical protein
MAQFDHRPVPDELLLGQRDDVRDAVDEDAFGAVLGAALVGLDQEPVAIGFGQARVRLRQPGPVAHDRDADAPH